MHAALARGRRKYRGIVVMTNFDWQPTPPTPAEVEATTIGADLMRRAARRIDRFASSVECKPWDADCFDEDEPWVVMLDEDFVGDNVPVVATVGPECAHRDIACWIALMGPMLATPLADWLNAAADDAEQIGADFRAVAVARAVLKGAGGNDD